MLGEEQFEYIGFDLSEVGLIHLEDIDNLELLQHRYIQAFRDEFLHTLILTLKSTKNINI